MKQDEIVRLKREIRDLLVKAVKITRAQVRAGRGSELDVIEAEVRLRNAEISLAIEAFAAKKSVKILRTR